ncbi:MAG: hypothetical protein JWN77_1577 [Frankiales bacterium]|jgi:hypothetical protein|nr:hypothetical protein [Frankiales bacterium]
MTDRPVQPDDLVVSLAVRKDLGPQHDEAVIGEFLDRVGEAIDQRVDARMKAVPLPADSPASSSGLGIVSLALGIPITAIALHGPESDAVGLVATVVAWAGIAAVNLAHRRR